MNRVLKNKKDCSGCGACFNVCPTKSIKMVEDETGFLYPAIDKKKCTDCGLCKKVCPSIISGEKSEYLKDCYVAYAEDEIRKISSSGGLFSILAEYILDDGGVVFGAAFDGKWNVKHTVVDCKEKLQLLRGSKYVQSDTGDTFKKVKEYLDKDKLVLYSGTACQIAGLKGFLQKDFPNLYTIDVLCHGTPSPKVWRLYLDKLNAEKVTDISFRDKSEGWKDYFFAAKYQDGSSVKRKFSEDIFMKMFLDNISLRPSCYSCKYKRLERESDLSLGDSWGIEGHMPEMDDDKGTSVVLVHSDKGEKLFNNIEGRIVCKKVNVDVALPQHADSRKPVKKHINYRKYMAKLKIANEFEQLSKYMELSIWDRVRRKIGHFLGE